MKREPTSLSILCFAAVALALLLGGCAESYAPPFTDQEEIAGDITEDYTLNASKLYLMTDQTFVKPGATLWIEPGTTIQALPYGRTGKAPVLVIERGARIVADGTADAPITFTSAMDPSLLPQRGLWGGLILLGNAPINDDGGEAFIEGLAGVPFGGQDPDDSSGVLRYVRVWYGGRSIGSGNEINGISFGGVGRNTVVEHCEVAWNNDDGFEFFGGTVNIKYLSVIFCGDDSFDTDEGYQGHGQFLFTVLGRDICGRGFEMDNRGSDMDAQPRSFPQFANVTLVGPGGGEPENDGSDTMIRWREGTGGDFRNLVVVNGNGVGIRVSDDTTLGLITQTPPDPGETDALYISPDNVVFNCAEGALHASNVGLYTVDETDPLLTSVDIGDGPQGTFDPRPTAGSPLLDSADALPAGDFYTAVTYRGAFDADDLWLKGFSWLDEAGYLP